jgi:hypothetical protein
MSSVYCNAVSSDVLSVNRVNVVEEKSERVIWYKVCSCLSVHSISPYDLGIDRTGCYPRVKSLSMWSCVILCSLR